MLENFVEVDGTDLSCIFWFLLFLNPMIFCSYLILFQLIVTCYSFGVKSILDYSVEVDEAEDGDAKKEEKKSWTFKKVNK